MIKAKSKDITSCEINANCHCIAESAFSGCSSLLSITIPNSVSSIGSDAFAGCSNLQYNEYNNALYLGNTENPFVALIKAKSKDITSCEINANCHFIYQFAFHNCTNLTSITIPNSVTSIGSSAFSGCSSLISMVIPFVGDRPDYDPMRAYLPLYGCSVHPDAYHYPFGYIFGTSSYIGGTRTIQYFEDYSNYTTLYDYFYIPSSLKTVTITGSSCIPCGAFGGCSSLTSIILPNNKIRIDANPSAFDGCKNLQFNEYDNALYLGNATNPYVALIKAKSTDILSCEINANCHCISASAFGECEALTNIFVGNSVECINELAFDGCTGLMDIIIPNSVTSICHAAFMGCTSLTSISIPNSVTSVGFSLFDGCTALDTVIVYSPTPPVSSLFDAFPSYPNAILYVPKGSKSAYEAADYWKEFKEIIEIAEIDIEDGEVYAQANDSIVDLHYTRTFSSTNWQALYVPFSIPIDSLTAHGLTVAELNDTHQWDLDGDGVADSTRLEFFTLTSGSTEANHPYLIRATEPFSFCLNMENVLVSKAECDSIDCSSTRQLFTFVGTYAGITGTEMYGNNYYAMAGGSLSRASSASVSLKPQRWFLRIENRNGSAVSYYAPSIRFCIDGIEEDETTGLSTMGGIDGVTAPSGLYSIEGIRQKSNNLKPGLYLSQGKKLVIR